MRTLPWPITLLFISTHCLICGFCSLLSYLFYGSSLQFLSLLLLYFSMLRDVAWHVRCKYKWAHLSPGVCKHSSTDIRVRTTNNRMDLALRIHCTSQRKPMTLLSPLLVSHTTAAFKPNRKIVLRSYKSENFL